MSLRQRLERICEQPHDHRALRVALLAEISARIPFDAHVWLLTDPESRVGSAPVATIPALAELPRLIRLKYLTPVNRWTTLGSRSVVTLARETRGELSASSIWREILRGYGVTDVVSVVFLDAHGSWGFLDLWRTSGEFTARECATLEEFAPAATAALRRSLMPEFGLDSPHPFARGGPAVLLLSDAIEILAKTRQTDACLRVLLPTRADGEPIPAAAYNVAAQLLAVEAAVDPGPPTTRAPLGNGCWVTLRAARVGPGTVNVPSIAVTIEPTPASERTDLYCRVAGLTGRESEVLRNLVDGSDTRAVAQRMSISQHTVQDHLKSIFAKTGATSRRVLTARATGAN